jgi:hypothetical protein
MKKTYIYIAILSLIIIGYACEKTIEIDLEDAKIKIKMAVCHLKMGENALAVKFLEEGLKKDSSLVSEFAYFYPEGSYKIEIERVIQQYKP